MNRNIFPFVTHGTISVECIYLYLRFVYFDDRSVSLAFFRFFLACNDGDSKSGYMYPEFYNKVVGCYSFDVDAVRTDLLALISSREPTYLKVARQIEQRILVDHSVIFMSKSVFSMFTRSNTSFYNKLIIVVSNDLYNNFLAPLPQDTI